MRRFKGPVRRILTRILELGERSRSSVGELDSASIAGTEPPRNVVQPERAINNLEQDHLMRMVLGISGVLMNALDRVSLLRPQPLSNKPVAIISAQFKRIVRASKALEAVAA